MSARTSRPSTSWYLIPIFIFLIGVCAAPAGYIIYGMAMADSFRFQLLTPGEKEFEIPETGKYVLWNEFQTIYNGQVFSSSTNLPSGLKIQLTDLKTGTVLPFSTSSFSASEEINGVQRHLVGTYQLVAHTKYRLSITGQFAQRIFYFRDSQLKHFMDQLSVALIIASTGILLSLGMGLQIFARRCGR
jgi:hypothetical protein